MIALGLPGLHQKDAGKRLKSPQNRFPGPHCGTVSEAVITRLYPARFSSPRFTHSFWLPGDPGAHGTQPPHRALWCGSVCTLPIPPSPHTAAHRRSHAGLGRCRPLTRCRYLHLLQLSVVVFIYHLLDRTERVQQVPIAFLTSPGGDFSWLGGDEPALLKAQCVLAYRVLAHMHRLPDGPVAGPALMRLAVLAAFEVTVHRQLAAAPYFILRLLYAPPPSG